MNRRQFLQWTGRTILAGTALSGMAGAADVDRANRGPQIDDYDRYDFILPRVRLKETPYKGRGMGVDAWNARPAGDANLLRELSAAIRCRVKPIPNTFDWEPQYAYDGQLNAVVTFDDLDALRKYPFLFVTTENSFELTERAKQNIKTYIKEGGFILMDDCVVGTGGDFFYRCAYSLLEELFGTGSVRPIPNEHEVFHNLYDLSATGLPWLHYIGSNYAQARTSGGQPHGQPHGARGLFIRDRLAVFLSSQDVHCGWSDSHGTVWGFDYYHKAIQMGINIVLYAMTH
jgi:hypothetical protein